MHFAFGILAKDRSSLEVEPLLLPRFLHRIECVVRSHLVFERHHQETGRGSTLLLGLTLMTASYRRGAWRLHGASGSGHDRGRGRGTDEGVFPASDDMILLRVRFHLTVSWVFASSAGASAGAARSSGTTLAAAIAPASAANPSPLAPTTSQATASGATAIS